MPIGRAARRRSVVVEAPGRIGNQLFATAAGYVAARLTDRDLLVDLSRLPSADGRARAEVMEFDWSFDDRIRFGDFPRTGIDRFEFRGATRLQNALSSLTAGAAPATLRVRQVGHEPRLESSARYARLVGYFQSAEHVAQANRLGLPRRLDVPHPSDWLTDVRQRGAEQAPVVVIVRLGDYRRFARSLGVLRPEYFASGLAALDPEGDRPIWLFCDDPDPDAGLGFLPPQARGRTWVVPQPVDLPRAQILLGASAGRDYVVSNSTFAWWAAWMSGEASAVVAPEPWFRRRPVDRIVPAGWQTQPAQWDGDPDGGTEPDARTDPGAAAG